MKINGLMKSGVVVLTFAALALTSIAPAAEAGNGRGKGHGRKYKSRGERVVYRHDRVVHRSDSGVGPAIIGFIGGVAVGSAISNSSRDRDHGYRDRDYRDRGYCDRDYRSRDRDRDYGYRGHQRADYSYYDPYCEQRFASFDQCRSHQRSCEHPREIRVIVASSGECVDTYRYRNGGWRDCD